MRHSARLPGFAAFAALLCALAPAAAQTDDFVESNRALYEPARQQALRADPIYLRLDNALYESGEDDRDAADAVAALLDYVGNTYPLDSDLHIAQLMYSIDMMNILDYENRHTALMRDWLSRTLPLAEAKLGRDDPRVVEIRTSLGWNYHEAGDTEKAVALLGFDPDAGSPGADSFLADSYAESEIARLEALEAERPALSGEALIANLRETADIHERGLGKYWNDYADARTAIMETLARTNRIAELQREARSVYDLYSAEAGGEMMTVGAAQYLAHGHSIFGDEATAIAVLGGVLSRPEVDYPPEYYTVPPQDYPLQPLYRVPQAKSHLARLLLHNDTDPIAALAASRYAVRYLRAFRQRQGFDETAEAELATAFAAPDEPFGQNAQEQFANLVEALWRNRQPGKGSDGLVAEAFLAAQDAMDEGTTAAIARTAALAAADRAGVGELVREREELSDLIGETKATLAEYAPGSEDYLSVERTIGQAEIRMADIDLALQRTVPEFFQLIRPEPIALPQARALLAPGEALVVILPTEYGTHVFAVTAQRAVWHRSAMTAAEIEDSVRLIRFDLDPWSSGRQDWDGGFRAGEAHYLYEELIAPVRSALDGQNTVLYAAGAALATLPLTVLVTETPDDPGRFPTLETLAWLADEFAIAQLPSLPSLAYLRSASDDRPRPDRPLAGFGDPVLEGKAAERGSRSGSAVGRSRLALLGTTNALADVAAIRKLARLPGTATELTTLRDTLDAGPGAILLGQAATEIAVKRADLSRARFVAFATHGLLAGEGEIAGEPGLVFTPPAGASLQDDGLLTASEILSLDLSADWVMLSACNTAAGDGLGGAGLSGLARSFFYAGARSLLASHWPVSDDMAPILTGEAVRLLDENPDMSRAEALRQSMRTARQSDIDLASHPASWAPFITVGDPR